jgi:hypothetical protein
VDAEEIASVLANAGIQTVILNACWSAHSSRRNAKNLAYALCPKGIENVVAMSSTVTASTACTFIKEMYTEFYVNHQSLSEAVYLAKDSLRRRLWRPGRFGIRITLQDEFVPVFYSQEESDLRWDPLQYEELAVRPAGLPPTEYHGINEYGLRAIEQAASTDSVVLLSGDGGVGKSCLVSQLALWWQQTGFIESYRILSAFTDKETLLSDDIYTWIASRDSSSGEDTYLSGRRLLVIDDFENFLFMFKFVLQTEERIERMKVVVQELISSFRAPGNRAILLLISRVTPSLLHEIQPPIQKITLPSWNLDDAFSLGCSIPDACGARYDSAVDAKRLSDWLEDSQNRRPLVLKGLLPLVSETPGRRVQELLTPFTSAYPTSRQPSFSDDENLFIDFYRRAVHHHDRIHTLKSYSLVLFRSLILQLKATSLLFYRFFLSFAVFQSYFPYSHAHNWTRLLSHKGFCTRASITDPTLESLGRCLRTDTSSLTVDGDVGLGAFILLLGESGLVQYHRLPPSCDNEYALKLHTLLPCLLKVEITRDENLDFGVTMRLLSEAFIQLYDHLGVHLSELASLENYRIRLELDQFNFPNVLSLVVSQAHFGIHHYSIIDAIFAAEWDYLSPKARHDMIDALDCVLRSIERNKAEGYPNATPNMSRPNISALSQGLGVAYKLCTFLPPTKKKKRPGFAQRGLSLLEEGPEYLNSTNLSRLWEYCLRCCIAEIDIAALGISSPQVYFRVQELLGTSCPEDIGQHQIYFTQSRHNLYTNALHGIIKVCVSLPISQSPMESGQHGRELLGGLGSIPETRNITIGLQ